MTPAPHVLILTPRGRDASVAASLLSNAGYDSKVVLDLASVVEALDEAVSMVLVTQEELATSDLRRLNQWLKSQPAWSDLPIVILTYAGGGPERNPQAARLLDLLGNVTFLERPFHPTTFKSIVKAAIGARLRQYEARTRMADLAESQERLRTALLAGNLGSWELDLATMTLDASASYKAIFGRKGDESFSYEDLVEAIHPDDRQRMQEAVLNTVQSGMDYEIEYRTIWPDGSIHWVEIHGRRLLDGQGAASKMVGVSSDITARKMFEQQLVIDNETLEARVVERTVELEDAHRRALVEVAQREKAEELLLQAQKVEAIGQLTGGVAHDFNNLLMAVLGNLEVLRRHVADDPRATRLIDGAMEGAKRGASLTQRLLAFARRQELEIKTIDFVQLIDGMMPLFRQSVGSNIEISIRHAYPKALAQADANQIELALLNLVVNARDAMTGGGTITISTDLIQVDAGETDLTKGEYIELAVIDSGNGMDAETLRRAVEPFFTTKGVGKGTGLGLSMIHGLALQLNGAFHLSSTLGVGTRARILLPIAGLEIGEVPVAEPEVADIRAAERSSVLIVDDDVLIAMSTVEMVEDLGHDSIEAYSGSAALEILQSGAKVDLMITDFSMPKMSGAELISAARALRPDLPIILASGYAELPSGVKLDVSRLSKPYRQADLAAQISALLARSQTD